MTADLTANVVEDYEFTSGTITWNDGDKSNKIIMVKIEANDDTAEGEESFNLVISNPSPETHAKLGKVKKHLVIIASKPERVGGTARITFRVSKDLVDESEESEELKTMLKNNVATALNIDGSRFYFKRDAIIAGKCE